MPIYDGPSRCRDCHKLHDSDAGCPKRVARVLLNQGLRLSVGWGSLSEGDREMVRKFLSQSVSLEDIIEDYLVSRYKGVTND